MLNKVNSSILPWTRLKLQSVRGPILPNMLRTLSSLIFLGRFLTIIRDIFSGYISHHTTDLFVWDKYLVLYAAVDHLMDNFDRRVSVSQWFTTIDITRGRKLTRMFYYGGHHKNAECAPQILYGMEIKQVKKNPQKVKHINSSILKGMLTKDKSIYYQDICQMTYTFDI